MLAHLWCDGVNWGDAAGWAEALAAGGALIFAAYQYSRHLLREQAHQASRVAVWAETFRYNWGGGANESSVVVHNGSDFPIYDCSVRLLPWDWKSRSSQDELDGVVFPTVRPMTSTNPEQLDEGLTAPPTDAGGDETLTPPYAIEFRDAAGVRWLRRPDGKLRRT